MKISLTSGVLVALLAACTAPRENFVSARPGVIGGSRAIHAARLVLHEASDGLVPVVIRGDPFAGRVVDGEQHRSPPASRPRTCMDQ